MVNFALALQNPKSYPIFALEVLIEKKTPAHPINPIASKKVGRNKGRV